MNRLITSVILIFINSSLYSQYYFPSVAVSDNVQAIEEFTLTKENEEFELSSVSKYENGRIISIDRNNIIHDSYEYRDSSGIEIIKRESINDAQNTLTKNYYDSLGRLEKSELYHISNQNSPIYAQQHFKYNHNNKLQTYEVVSYSKNKEFRTRINIEYIDEYTIRETSTHQDGDLKFVSELRYNEDFTSAILTTYMQPKGKKKNNTNRLKSIFDEFGNMIKLYKVNKRNKMELVTKRNIKFK